MAGESLYGDPERLFHEAVKLKLDCDAKDARIMGHLPRRAANREWNQPRKEVEGAGDLKSALTSGRETVGVSLLGFSLALA